MDDLKNGVFAIDETALAAILADFASGRTDEAETAATMQAFHTDRNYLADPHTAVGLAVAKRFARPGVPMVTLATAHPAKFPAAVLAATGTEAELPARLGDLMERPEHFTTIADDQLAVEYFIAAHTRALAEKV